MWKDPIVQEVRKVGEKLAKQAGYNLHTFFQKLRKNEEEKFDKMSKRIVSKKRVKVTQMPAK